ncbi:MAG: acetyl-CoA carboxylase carboxyl transferase subunit beta [Armatimonadetes bacterium]|nr:acetyl-CoA carboxylase carboxyl transferase subunit beta [Armatimonadota bacterium]
MPNGWFRRRKQPDRAASARAQDVPEGLWQPCTRCRELLFTPELERNLKVCSRCGYHFPLSARQRVSLLLDPDSFVETDTDLETLDPLHFPRYLERLAHYREVTGLKDAALCGEGTVEGIPVTLAVTDAGFLMGSMNTVVGEQITRTVERATDRGWATILVSGSGGGARMQEGLLSLMQMPKTSAALARHHAARRLAIVILTDPSMGGVQASWGSLGDVILAEPGARVAFAGPRVAQQAGVQKPPPDYQTAEFCFRHGQLDRVCPRRELRDTVARLLRFAAVPVRSAHRGHPVLAR